MATMASATLDLAKALNSVAEGTATGGSTTTLVDTTNRTEPDDYFDNGTIWFLSGNNNGKSAVISDYDLPTKTFTFVNPGAACAAGDRYGACNSDYPRWLLIQCINRALGSIGSMPQFNTGLTTVADQEAYSLPTGVRNIKRVESATELTSPLNYKRHQNWSEVNGQLLFDTSLAPDSSGYTIRLTYLAAHSVLSADTDAVSANIYPDWLSWEAAVHALRWRMQRTKGDEPWIIRLLNEALTNAQKEAGKWPTPKFYRDPHLASW